MIFILRGLQTREKPKRLTEIVRQAGYPKAGNFLLPPGDDAVRLTFTEAKKTLEENGHDIGDDEYADIE